MFDINKNSANKHKSSGKKQRIFIIGASITSLIASGENLTTTDPQLFSSGDVTGTPTSGNDNITLGTNGGIVNVGAGADNVVGGDAIDTILGGAGADIITGGAGLDNLVVIGITLNANYTIEDLQNVAGTGVNLSSLLSLADINNHSVSDVEPGESIDGGADGAILYTFGMVDFSGVTLANITKIYLDAEVTISDSALQSLISTGLTDLLGNGIIKAQTGLLDLDGLNVPPEVTIKDSEGNVILPEFQSETKVDVAENSTNVGTFTVTDASAVGNVTYALSGVDAALFSLNSSTGEVEFIAAPDYETISNAFNLTITATDEHQKSTTQNVEITVTDVNDAPSFESGTLQVNAAENQTIVANVTATDADNDSLTYSLSGADAALFTINSTSGEISFITPEDFEHPTHSNQQYSVTVGATDGAFSANRNVEITVTDVGAAVDPAAPILAAPSIQPYGTEYRVNTHTNDGQDESSVAGLVNGGYVVVWTSANQDGSSDGVYGQRYDNVGTALGDEFLVNSYTSDRQYTPKITGLNDGGFVVVWYSAMYGNDGEPYEIRGQRYNAEGVAQDDEFQVNTGDYYLGRPFISSLTGGGFVVTWYADVDASSNDDYDGFGQIFDANGNPHGNEFQINTHSENTQYPNSVTSLADGSFIVAWYSYEQDGSDTGSYFQKFDADGIKVGDETLINLTTNNHQRNAVVSALDSGGFVAVWVDSGVTSGNQDLKANVYTADGSLLRTEFSINQFSTNSQYQPQVIGLSDGGFLVTWSSDEQDGDNYGIYGRRFAADGQAIADEFLINITTNGAQNYPAITALSDGGFVVTWDSPDGSKKGIFSQIFTTNSYKFIADNSYKFNLIAELPDGQTGFTLSDITITGIPTGISFVNGSDAAVGTLVGDTLTLTQAQLTDLHIKIADGYDENVDLTLTVTSADGQGVHTKTELSVAIDIVHTPQFANDDVQTFNIDENTTSIGTITATDAENQTLAYTLSGNDASLFSINSITGEITLIAAEDYENPTRSNNKYDLNVIAHDTEGLTGTKAIVVNVIDIDEAPQFASDDAYITYMADNQTDVATLLATDEDNDAIVYSLTGNVDDGLFTIDGTTGKINFNALPDFDTPADAGADNIYNISVTATANGLTDTREVEIHLTNSQAPILHVSNQLVQSGAEFLVNSHTSNSQSYPSISSLSDGSFVITWVSNGQDGSFGGVFGQKFSQYGTALGDEFQVNTNFDNDQNTPSVASLQDGGFVIVWDSYKGTGNREDIFGQRYDATGQPLGDEFSINTITSQRQYNAVVAGFDDGSFIVTWTSGRTNTIIKAQRFDSMGDPDGVEFKVNIAGKNLNSSAITVLENDGFVVVWQAYELDGDGSAIGGQIYDAAGIADAAGEFQINTYTDSNQDAPAITTLKNGGFVVIWASTGQDSDDQSNGIYGQMYDAAGAEVGSEFLVNTETTEYQDGPKITALSDGGFVATWHSQDQDGDVYGVFGQRYDSDGVRNGEEFQINSTTENYQFTATVTATQNGGFVVAWASDEQDGSDWGVYSQIFEAAPLYKLETGTTADFNIVASIQPDQVDVLSDVTITGVPLYISFTDGDDSQADDGEWTFTQAQLDGLRITTNNGASGEVELTLSVSSLDSGNNNVNATTITKLSISIGETPSGADENDNIFDLQTANVWHVDGMDGSDTVQIFDSGLNDYDYEISGNDLLISYTNHTYLMHSIEQLDQNGTLTNVADLYTELGMDQAEYNIWLANSFDYDF